MTKKPLKWWHANSHAEKYLPFQWLIPGDVLYVPWAHIHIPHHVEKREKTVDRDTDDNRGLRSNG